MAILFHSKSESCREFSNFAPYVIELEGKRWPTAEHYYQAQKFLDAAYQRKIRQALKPVIAFQLARSADAPPRRADWAAIKDDVMRRAVAAKFGQHEALRDLLLATGDEDLVEHSRNDPYWGDGGDGSGQNKLGHILMALREELRASR